MEVNSNADYFAIHPPRLEDAGLEDPALPVEGIQEAFQRAAEAVKSTTASLLHINTSECTENPGPSNGEWEDSVLDGSTAGKFEGARSCVETQTGGIIEEGHDMVIDGKVQREEDRLLEGEDVGPKLGEQRCVEYENVDDLPKPEAVKGGEGGIKDPPTLTGAYL